MGENSTYIVDTSVMFHVTLQENINVIQDNEYHSVKMNNSNRTKVVGIENLSFNQRLGPCSSRM